MMRRRGGSYTPPPTESVQVPERGGDVLVAEDRSVLFQHLGAHLRILGLRHGIFGIDLFKAVERTNDAIDLGEGVEKVLLRGGRGELDLLGRGWSGQSDVS